jgi:hypothetical protein
MEAYFVMSLAIARVLRYPADVSLSERLMALVASVCIRHHGGVHPSPKTTTIHPADIIRA